jgi:hypothetical protein
VLRALDVVSLGFPAVPVFSSRVVEGLHVDHMLSARNLASCRGTSMLPMLPRWATLGYRTLESRFSMSSACRDLMRLRRYQSKMMKTTITMTPRAMAESRSAWDGERDEGSGSAFVGVLVGELGMVCLCFSLGTVVMDIVACHAWDGRSDRRGVDAFRRCYLQVAVRRVFGSMSSYPYGWVLVYEVVMHWSANVSVPLMVVRAW